MILLTRPNNTRLAASLLATLAFCGALAAQAETPGKSGAGRYRSQIVQTGTANAAAIQQAGSGQSASVTQTGDANAGIIRQYGRGNDAALSQDGSGNAGCVLQVGRDLGLDLAQQGDGASVGVIQTARGARIVPVEACRRQGNPRNYWGR